MLDTAGCHLLVSSAQIYLIAWVLLIPVAQNFLEVLPRCCPSSGMANFADGKYQATTSLNEPPSASPRSCSRSTVSTDNRLGIEFRRLWAPGFPAQMCFPGPPWRRKEHGSTYGSFRTRTQRGLYHSASYCIVWDLAY